MVAGEITTETYIPVSEVVRRTIREIGYTDARMGFDAETCGVLVSLDQQSPDIKRGVISMAHAFGAHGDDADSVRAHGSSTNRLVDDERDYDRITGQCRQSAIPVRVRRH